MASTSALSFSSGVGSYVPSQRLQLQRAAEAAAQRAQDLQRESERVRTLAESDLRKANELRQQSNDARDESSSTRSRANATQAQQRVGAPQAAALPEALVAQPEASSSAQSANTSTGGAGAQAALSYRQWAGAATAPSYSGMGRYLSVTA